MSIGRCVGCLRREIMHKKTIQEVIEGLKKLAKNASEYRCDDFMPEFEREVRETLFERKK